MDNQKVFDKWLRDFQSKISKTERYTKTVITLSNDLKKHALSGIDIYSVESPDEAKELKDLYFSNKELLDKNSRGNHMYSRAFDLYIEFLRDINKTESIVEDINEINSEKNITETVRKALIDSRIGQGLFRRNLLDYWKCCAVTGFSEKSCLVASHIKPWNKSTNNERLDVFNGLLLTPNLDKAFDVGFISFNKAGGIIISDLLTNFEGLAINEAMKIRVCNDHEPYLHFHRSYVLK